MSIPSTSDLKIKPSVIWQILKDLIGKDLSTFSLPVFLNEPLSVLQKSAEMIAVPFSQESEYHPDSCRRMCAFAATTATGWNQILGRLQKPFNPLLGETYELVTPKFRFFSECVSHHPPIFALNL